MEGNGQDREHFFEGQGKWERTPSLEWGQGTLHAGDKEEKWVLSMVVNGKEYKEHSHPPRENRAGGGSTLGQGTFTGGRMQGT